MPSKAAISRRKLAHVGHRHRVQVQNANNVLGSPTRRPATQTNQPVAGPSSRPYDNRDRRTLIAPAEVPSARPVASPSSQLDADGYRYNQAFIEPTFTNPFHPAPRTPTPFYMELDGHSEYGSGSTTSNRMSVTSNEGDDSSDGSSTVVPMDFEHSQAGPQNLYFVTATDLDNLRNTIHFMHHATVLVSATLDTMRSQNPHCPYLRRT
ncbi:hypothetical protein H1R20_g15423, partial [Candolleomyces eurysporus]